jgi:hypothetical protein
MKTSSDLSDVNKGVHEAHGVKCTAQASVAAHSSNQHSSQATQQVRDAAQAIKKLIYK